MPPRPCRVGRSCAACRGSRHCQRAQQRREDPCLQACTAQGSPSLPRGSHALGLLQVRRMEAAAAAAIASAQSGAEGQGGWPEALRWMEQAAGSQAPLHREMALVLLAAFMEKIGARAPWTMDP